MRSRLIALSFFFLDSTNAHAARIAFSSNASGNSEIYSIDADGTDLRNLTDHPADDFAPVWSPDARRIAFVSDRDNPHRGIYVMDAHGANPIHLTRSIEHLGYFSQLAWSPDGTRIAFAAVLTDEPDSLGARVPKGLYVLDADGSNLIDLDIELASIYALRAFPDIVTKYYDTNFWGGQPTRKADQRLSNYAPGESAPTWSPDGRRIATADING